MVWLKESRQMPNWTSAAQGAAAVTSEVIE
jgi:hypothetical protein